MADPLDPAGNVYSPMAIRPGDQRRTQGEIMATASNGGLTNLSSVLAASPELRSWVDTALGELGVQPGQPNRDFLSAIERPLPHEESRTPFEEVMADPMVVRDRGNFDLMRAIGHGLGSTFVGGMVNYLRLHDASRWQNDPTYDVWSDPAIVEAGLANQYELFHGTRSAAMAQFLIHRFNDHQREARTWADMAGPKEEVALAAGILGDPLMHLPATLGLRGASLAMKASRGTLTAAEKSIVMSRAPVYGLLGDGLRGFALSAALGIGENAIATGFDPVDRIDQVANDIVLPSAIAGSMAMVLSASSRFSARLNSLAADARKARFLEGTVPDGTRGFSHDLQGARFVGEDFVGPTVPADRSAAEALLMPSDMRPETPLQRIEAAKSKFPVTPNNGTGVFDKGALATDYGDMLKREVARDPANAPFVAKAAQRETRGFLESGSTSAGPGSGLAPPAEEVTRHFGTVREGHPVDAVGRAYTTGDVEHRGHWTLQLDAIGSPGQRRLVAAEHEIGTEALDYNGVLWRVGERDQGKLWEYVSSNPKPRTEGRLVDQEFKPGELPAAPGSAGAALAPGSNVYREDVLRAQGRQAPTGLGIENLPLNPWARIALGTSWRAMQLMGDLVSSGGRLTMGNLAGVAGLPPVETLIQTVWNKPMADSLRHMADQWSEYRRALGNVSGAAPGNAVTPAGQGDFGRLREQIGTAVKDFFTPGQQALSYHQFRRRAGDALNNGDVDTVTDGATRYVQSASAKHRELYNRVRDEAIETGLFDDAAKKAKARAYAQVDALKREAKDVAERARREGWPPDRTRAAEEALIARTEDAEFKAEQAEREIERLRTGGPQLNTAPSYRPRLWNVGALLDDEEGFVSTVTSWLRSGPGGNLDLQEAARIAKQIHETLSRQNPVYERGDVDALFMSVASPSGAMARTFRIPDKLVSKYLENDAEVLLRYHMRQMGTALEMQKRFGNLDLAEQIAEVEQEYRGLIVAANQGSPVATEKAISLTQEMKTTIADLQATRDKLYGTYGAAVDPTRLSSRMIRMAKQYTNLTLLGMSGITALGDLVRPLMTEGIDAVYGVGIRSLMSESRGTILRMNAHELELMGDGMDMIKNVRALSAADTGDVFGARGGFERGLMQANSLFFVANGLNAITDFTKQWASLNIIGRISPLLLDATVDWKIPQRDIGRFAAVGIGPVEAKKIGLMIQIHGQEYGKLIMPNTEKWADQEAALIYRTAVHQMVNRTIPTPGIGDLSNWQSTEWGSLIGQYKAFAVAAQIRQLQSGLQEGGSQFWYGAAAMVGFAVLLNEMRSRLFYERSTFDKPATAVIADAVDRSSLLGYFSDANRAVEALTGNRVGMRPMVGAASPRPVNYAQATGMVLGPAAGQAVRAAGVADDFIKGHPTARTYANWRTLIPGNTLPYADPVFDRLVSDGNYHRMAPMAAQIDKHVARQHRQQRPQP